MADRLGEIFEKIGYALWQIQELEGALATYYVLVVLAEPGMGSEAGMALEEEESKKKKTLGQTIRQLRDANLLDTHLEANLRNLLKERNWLVHKSRAASRSAAHHDEAALALIARIDGMADQALALLRLVSAEIHQYVNGLGVSDEEISTKSIEILDQWHADDGL